MLPFFAARLCTHCTSNACLSTNITPINMVYGIVRQHYMTFQSSQSTCILTNNYHRTLPVLGSVRALFWWRSQCTCVLLTFVVVGTVLQLYWSIAVAMYCCGALQQQGVHYEYALYSGIRASVCPLVVMYVGTPWESTCMTAPPCMYVWRCSHKFIEPNYRSALRVVIPTRLTIVRSLLCWNVYIGNKRTNTSFFKYGFATLKLWQAE